MFSSRILAPVAFIVLLAMYQLASVDSAEEWKPPSITDQVTKMYQAVNEKFAGAFSFFPLKWLLEIVGCVYGDLEGLNCNFNFSFDIFYVLENCVQDPVLKVLIKKIEEDVPAIKYPIAIPANVTNDLCYDPMSHGKDPIIETMQNYVALAMANIPKDPDSIVQPKL